VKDWVLRNPGSVPVTIQIDLKATAGVVAWSSDQLKQLNDLLVSTLRDVTVTPEAVRARTNYNSLREGVFRSGWPTLDSMKGKALVMITGGPLGYKNQTQKAYVQQFGAEAAAFVCPNAEDPDDFKWDYLAHDFDASTSKWVVCGNIKRGNNWQDYLFQSHFNKQLSNIFDSDATFFERFHNMYLAVGWGGNMISRDNTNTDGGHFGSGSLLYGLRDSVPVFVALQSVAYTDRCVGLQDDKHEKGEDITARTCADRVTWLYTDDLELRISLGSSDDDDLEYCVDVQDEDPVDEAVLHLWKCDGGDSQKWEMRSDGSFQSVMRDPRNYCIGMPDGSVKGDLRLQLCDGGTDDFFKVLSEDPTSNAKRKSKRALKTLSQLRKKERRRRQ
jgi:hypothetical protein